MPSHPYPVPRSSRPLTILAWIVTILVSTVPDIAFDQWMGRLPAWLPWVKMGLLLALAACALAWKPLRPLRNFFLLMFALFGLYELRPQIDFTWPFLQSLFGGSAFDLRMQAEQTGKLAVSLTMLALLLVLGYKRRDIFLRCGDLRTPIEPVKPLGFFRPVPWTSFALQWGFYIALTLAVVQYLGLRPDSSLLLKVLPVLPSILFYAALNAFNEEAAIRLPMLASLEPVGGSRHALWMSAVFFGIAHYFGTPGGLPGGLLSIFMGWMLGKAVLETRGLFWAWWIHFLSDVAIFTFLALALFQ